MYLVYSFLFISIISFVTGGSGVIKFLYSPASPPPTVWALKLLVLLVHKTIYAPMIYTALCIMFWMRAYPLLGKWEGLGPVEIIGA